jgi:hypothetical protein
MKPSTWASKILRWLEDCDALGATAHKLAGILLRLNGAWWRWTWKDSLMDLHTKISGDYPGVIGRDAFLSAWRALEAAGLVLLTKTDGWIASVAADLPRRSCPQERSTRKCTSTSQDRRPSVAPDSGSPSKERASVCAVVPVPTQPSVTTDLPSAPMLRSTMPMPANDRPAPAPKPLHPSIAKRCGKALARGWRPEQADAEPQRPETPTADVGALEGASRGQVTRPGYMTPAELARLAGAPEPVQPPAPEPPPQSPTLAPVSTEAVFYQQRYPKLCELSERLWGQHGRWNVEMKTGVHHEMLRWSLRATDSVWADALDALSRAKTEPGSIGLYLAGILRRTVPVAEKARRGDVTVPVAPERAPKPAAPSTRPAPRRRTLADLLLAQQAAACNLSGAHDPESRPQGPHNDHDLGGDRHDDRLLGSGGRRAS